MKAIYVSYTYVAITIVLTIYGQVVLKWRLNKLNEMPVYFSEKIKFLITAFFDLYILSSFLAAFIASLTWMLAVKNLELSKVYPMMSLSFVGVSLVSYIIFSENFDVYKVLGTALVLIGVILIARSA